MPEASNGDVTVYYEDEGAGKPVLLIHGHTLDRRVWEPIMPALNSAGCRVLRPDLRGHGLSTRPDGGYHVSHHATDMAAVLDAAGVVRTTVVGFSIGGGIALEMALTMPWCCSPR
jgi:pimeloyl-ACP methyl ester carboxylesterase